jgi:hypothetical protein
MDCHRFPQVSQGFPMEFHLAEALEEWHSAVQVATAKACESAALSSPGTDESWGYTKGLDVYRT